VYVKKSVIIAVLSVLGVGGIGYGGYWVVSDVIAHRNATRRAAFYLYGPTDVKNDKGEGLTRAQLIDALLKEVLAKQQPAKAGGFVTPPPPPAPAPVK
jgi:hypothetical protein